MVRKLRAVNKDDVQRLAVNTGTTTHRGPEDSSVQVRGLFDTDLHVREDVSLPGL